MRIVITTTLNDNLFHAKLIPLVRSRDDLELVVVSDRQGPAHERIKWVWPQGKWQKLGRLGGRLPLLLWEVLNPRTDLVMAYSVIPHGLFAMPCAWLKEVPLYLHFIAGKVEIEFADNPVHAHNRVIINSKHPHRLEAIARWVSEKADKIFVPGSNTADFLRRRDYPESKIVKLHSTIDPKRFYANNTDRDIDVIVVAQVRAQKRPLFTLRVFQEILKQRPDARFCWLGDGEMHDEFDRALDELNLRQSVIWMETNEVEAFYRRAKLFLLCSQNEGLSLASMEAMACGVVPISTDCGDMSDTVINDQTGVCLPTDSPHKNFADAALGLLENQDLWSTFSWNSVEIIRSEHSFDSAIAAWQRILADL